MKVVDLLVFLAQIKCVGHATAIGNALGWLDRLDVGDWSFKKVDDLSKGMQQADTSDDVLCNSGNRVVHGDDDRAW